MAFSAWASGFGKEFRKFGVSASDASARAQGYASASVDPSSAFYEGPRVQRRIAYQGAGFGGGGAGSTGGGVDPATSAALEKAISYYSPEGGYGKGVEAGLERGRVKTVASGMQGLVSAGLAGTTMAGGLGKKYEEEVAMPARARVEETRAQAISGLQVLKAQITQGATEAARTRALQKYLAQLQASTQIGAAGMPATSSITSAPARAPTGTTQQGADNFYTKPRESFGSIAGGNEPYQFEAAETIYGDPTVRGEEGQPIGERQTGIYTGGSYTPFPKRWS